MRLLFVLLAACLSACATIEENAQIEQFASPTASAVIFEVRETGFVCGDGGAAMRLQRKSDGAITEIYARRGLLDGTIGFGLGRDAPVRLQALEPGVWQPVAMLCHHSIGYGTATSVGTMDRSQGHPLSDNFGPFEVRVGEIVYPGTFEAYDPAMRNFARQYPSARGEFRLLDEAERQRQKLVNRYPELASRWVVRLAQPQRSDDRSADVSPATVAAPAPEPAPAN